MIRILAVLCLFSFFLFTNALAQTNCVDTDPVGDGWGWDGSQSCRVGSGSNNDSANNSSSTCVDTDPVGDGWGWDGSQSCRVGSGSNNDSANNSLSSCVDTDPVGDGWGWDGSQSCRVGSGSNNDSANNSLSTCVDTDPVGDGWGWDGSQSCRVGSSNSDTANNSSSTCVDTDPVGDGWGWNGATSCRVNSNPDVSNGSIPQSFSASYTGFSDTDGDNVADQYDIDFNGGLDKNRNGIDDIYETEFRNGVDSNGNGIEDSAEYGLASGNGSSVVVRSDGADTENVESLFVNAWGAVDLSDQNCNGGHAGFGSHIHETYDQSIGSYVFKFIMHAREDIDCAIPDTDDRQRLQVVNSGRTPAVLATSQGDWLTYRYDLFIPEDFAVSSQTTTLFQLKYFRSSLSEFLFVARNHWSDEIRGEPSLIYYHHPSDDSTDRKVLLVEPLHRYQGKWLDVFVRTRSSDSRGVLQVIVRDLSTGDIISEIFEDELDMWREGKVGMKASYGIYRFTNGEPALIDEEIYMDSICIAKGTGRCLAR